MTEQPRATSRLTLLDGLRGLAAVAVAIFHISTIAFHESLEEHDVFAPLASRGYLGVYVFFVVSGFVIAYALRGVSVDLPYAARFVLRRSVRLDPPYWAAILCSIGLAFLTARIVGDPFVHPTIPQVLSHIVYAQGLLGFTHLSQGLWTLCIEVQFYIVLVLYLVLSGRWSPLLRTSILVAIVVASAFLFQPAKEIGEKSLLLDSYRSLLPNLCFFGLGVVTWWAVAAPARRWFGMVSVGWLAAFVWSLHPELLAGWITAALIFVAAINGGLTKWLASRLFAPIIFLGTISYSLYLIHVPACQLSLRIVRRFAGAGATDGWPGLAIGLAAAVLAGTILNRVVERPAQRFARSWSVTRLSAGRAK